jgi:Amt family ammonium transporter
MVVVNGIDLDDYYIVKVPYNGTGATGGNSETDDLNIWYEVKPT